MLLSFVSLFNCLELHNTEICHLGMWINKNHHEVLKLLQRDPAVDKISPFTSTKSFDRFHFNCLLLGGLYF